MDHIHILSLSEGGVFSLMYNILAIFVLTLFGKNESINWSFLSTTKWSSQKANSIVWWQQNSVLVKVVTT